MGFAVVLVLGNIIGSGVFKKAAPMAAELHSSGWILVCWALGGLFTIFGAISNAEVASMLADTGGEFSYYRKIYNKFFSYIYGWSNLIAIKTASIASVAYVFAHSLNSLVRLPPLFESLQDWNILGIFYPFQGFQIKLACILLILLLTWFNSRGLKLGANLSTIVLLLVLVGIISISAGGSFSSNASLSSAWSFDTGDAPAVTISAIFTAMLAAFWGYEGWNSIGFLGGEIKNAHRNLPIAIILGLFIVVVLYMAANMAYMSVLTVPEAELINARTEQVIGIEATRTFWGEPGVLFISILICLSTFGCTHATIISSSRTTFAMAKEGLFFRKAAVINKKNVPGGALWIHGIWASVLVLSGTFDQLTDMLIFAAFIFYGATTLGVFILRYKMPNAPRPYKVWGYPVIPAIFIVFCIFLIGNTLYARPREASVGLVLISIGIPFYWWIRRRNKEEVEGLKRS